MNSKALRHEKSLIARLLLQCGRLLTHISLMQYRFCLYPFISHVDDLLHFISVSFRVLMSPSSNNILVLVMFLININVIWNVSDWQLNILSSLSGYAEELLHVGKRND